MASIDFLHIMEDPVTLHSKGLSQFLIVAGGLYKDERMRMAIIAHWKAYLNRTLRRNRLHIIGIERGGTLWAAALYKALDKDAPGEHTLNKSSDDIKQAEKPSQVVLVDDVLTTGGSLVELAERLHENIQAFPAVSLVVVNRAWIGAPEIWAPKVQKLLNVRSWARIPLPMEVS